MEMTKTGIDEFETAKTKDAEIRTTTVLTKAVNRSVIASWTLDCEIAASGSSNILVE
jgi:hypothetical protein